jgi:hypothetical protein
MMMLRAFIVDTAVPSLSKAGPSAPDVKSGPAVRVRVSTATMMMPSVSALNASRKFRHTLRLVLILIFH